MHNRGFAFVVAGSVVFFLMLIMNILQLGSGDWIAWVNNLTLLTFGAFSTVSALTYSRLLPNRLEAKRVWLVLGVGLGFDLLGQLTWMEYNMIGDQVPYPSPRDLFWIISYLLLFVAVVNKIRLLGVWPSKGQVTVAAALGVIFFLWIGNFVLLPTLENARNAPAVETVLNFSYPIMDFLLLAAAGFLVLILWKGKLSLPWNILASGFLCMAAADVFFSYSDLNELYYAEGSSVNLLTRGVDVVYVLAAYLIALGVYLNQWAKNIPSETIEFQFSRTILAGPMKPKLHPFTPAMQALFDRIFFMVDADYNVYFFSRSYREFCQLADDTSSFVVGTPLHMVLGIEKDLISNIFSQTLPGSGNLVSVNTRIGTQSIPAALRIMPARNGCDVFLRYRHEDKPIVVTEQKSVEFLLVEQTLQSVQGLESSSMDMRSATAFFLIEIQEMYLFLVHMGGYRVGQVLAEKFNQMAMDQCAAVRITDGSVVLTAALETRTMFNLLQLTLRTVEELTSTEATSRVLKHLNQKIPEGVVRSAQNAGLAL